MEAAIALASALISGIPKLVELVRAGRDIKDIKLEDFVSHDALATFRKSAAKVDDFVNNG